MSSRPDWAREGRGWPNAAFSQFVKAAGLTWHVQVAGQGPVLLLLHGTGAATHSWRDLLPMLTPHFTVVAPDLPGHGFTRGALDDGPTLPGVASAVSKLLTALDVTPSFIVGHSAGAAIGLRMVLDGLAAPDTFVALSPALLPFPGLAAQLFPTLAKMLFVNPFAPHIFARMAGPQREIERFLIKSTGSHIEPAGIEFYARLFRKPGHIAGTIAMMANWDLVPLKRDLPRLGVPLTVIHGEGDTAIPLDKAREATGLVPHARLHVLPGLGHLAHEEQPRRIADLILASMQGGDSDPTHSSA
jgi:magnesium chelatase accessory protein